MQTYYALAINKLLIETQSEKYLILEILLNKSTSRTCAHTAYKCKLMYMCCMLYMQSKLMMILYRYCVYMYMHM